MDSSSHQKKTEPLKQAATRPVDDAERKAFAQVVNRYESQVFRHLFRRLADRGQAADLTQEVFAKAWRGWPAFDQSRQPWPWLREIADNALTDFFRSENTQKRDPDAKPHVDGLFRIHGVVTEDGHDSVDPGLQPWEEASNAEQRRIIYLAIETLSVTDRQMIRQYYFDGIGIDEIARLHDKSEAAVHSALHRARNRLRSEIESRGVMIRQADSRSSRSKGSA